MDKKITSVYRFAPSPTGLLHVGGARTAIFNWLLAKRDGGKFLLRIEDTDQKRSSKESLDQILNSLNWLEIQWDDSPYFQSQHQERHQQIAQELLTCGKAYHCFCTAERLQEERKKAEKIYANYKQHLISGLNFVSNSKKIEGDNYVIINAKSNIKDTIIGTIASIL